MGNSNAQLNASDILSALRKKHHKDIFVSEVKAGSSWLHSDVPRMDAWVMNPSWANPQTTAYEIKVSRGDFLSDEKWENYLPFCNKFWFVVPWKMVKPEEVPKNAGLMWCTSTGNRVIRKRKPEYRECDPSDLDLVYRYLLMWRTQITREQRRQVDSVKYWKDWLKQKKDKKKLGQRVSNELANIVRSARREEKKAREKVEGYEFVRKRLEELGFNPEIPITSWSLPKIDRKIEGQIEDVLKEVRSAKFGIEKCERELQQAVEKSNDSTESETPDG